MAAEAELKILIKAKDEATAILNKIEKRTGMTTAQFKKMGLIATAAGLAIAAGLAYAVKKAADFQTSIINAASVTGLEGAAMEEAMMGMADKAKELGRTTAFTASQVAEAMYDLSSKGFRPAEMSIDSLKGYLDLAAATQADLTLATETVTSTIRMFGFANEESTRIADVFTKAIGLSAAKLPYLAQSMKFIGPVAKAMDMSLEETVAVLTALYDRGIDASAAATGMRGVMAILARESPKLTKGLAKYGLTVEELSVGTKGFIPVLKILGGAQIEYNDLVKMFNVRGAGMIAALTGVDSAGIRATDTMSDMQKALEEAGGTAERVADIQLSSLAGQLTILKSAIEGVIIPIGEEFIPAITKAATMITDLIGTITDIAPWFTKLIAWGGAAAAALLLIVGPLFLIIGYLPMFMKGLPIIAALLAKVGIVGLAALGPIAAILAIILATIILVIAQWDDFIRGLKVISHYVTFGLAPMPGFTEAQIEKAARAGLTERARAVLPSMEYGGIVPGAIGAPVPIIAHGQERFLGPGGGETHVHIHVGALMGKEEDARAFARLMHRYIREEVRVGTVGITV